MSRRVCQNEFAFGCGEVTIGNVDSDPLLAFRAQPVGQQRKIDFATADRLFELIFVSPACVMQEPPDQRGFPVVNTPRSSETQEVFRLLLPQKLFYVENV